METGFGVASSWARRAYVVGVVVTVTAATSAVGQGPAHKSISSDQVARLAVPATVLIETYSARGDTLGLGSGFIVRSNGTIVTNWHVMRGASSASVRLSTGEVFRRVTFVDGDSLADIAIIKVPGYGLPVVATTGDVPRVGSAITVVGNPLGLTETVSNGIVSARRVVNGVQRVQLSAPISHGSSGGPVLDRQGRAFAIVTSLIEGGQQLNFAVPVRYALGLIAGKKTEKPLAEVFGVESQGGGEAEMSTSGSGVEVPQPTAAVAGGSIVGTYDLDMRFDSGRKSLYTGVLLVAAPGTGVAVITTEPSKLQNRIVLWLVRSIATSDGRVMIELDEPYDGFQTSAGFYVARSYNVDSSRTDSISITAKRSDWPLSRRDGLFEVTGRTYWEEGEQKLPDPVDWTGSAAVVFAKDSVFVDLSLGNSSGGKTGGVFSGPLLPDMSFSLRSSVGTKQLSGSFVAGAFSANWVDTRESGGTFRGQLNGERR